MGVDATLFAVKAQKCFFCFRAYNVRVPLTHGEKLFKKLSNGAKETISYKDMYAILTNNVKAFLTPGFDGGPEDWGRAKLNLLALEFIKMHPKDKFMFITDHDDPSDYEVKQSDNYTEIEYEELEKLAEPTLKIMRVLYNEPTE